MSETRITIDRIRKELLVWHDLKELWGPTEGHADQFFLSFEMEDGERYYIELTRDKGEL